MIATIIQNIIPACCLVLLFYIATGLGIIALSNLKIPFNSPGEGLFFSFGIGSAVVSYTIFTLAVFQILYPAWFVAFLSAFSIVSFFGWRSFILHRPFVFSSKITLHGLEKLFFAFLMACVIGSLLITLTPEIGKDALSYHLAVPKLYLKNHGFYFIEGNVFANYPLLGEMLYLLGLFLHNDIAAKGIHFMFSLAILLGMNMLFQEGSKQIRFRYLSMLIFFSVPSVFIVSHVANNDLIVTYYSFGAVIAFINWSKQCKREWLIMFGTFTGLAIACKYTSLLIPFLGVLGILWTAHRLNATTTTAVRYLFIYVVAMTIIGSPFYIKNFIETGNPFYPFLYSIFGGAGWDEQQARYYDFFLHSLGMGREIVDYLLLPWNLSINAQMDSIKFDGILGPVFLIMLPFALGMRKTDAEVKIMAIYCLSSFVFWALSVQQVRYLFHILPFMAVLAGITLAYYHDHNKNVFRLLLALIFGCLIFNFYYIIKDFQTVRPLAFIAGQEDRSEFLGRNIHSYRIIEYVNKELPPDSRIFTIYMKNFGFLYDRNYYSDSMFESYTIQKILSQSQNTKDVHRKLKDKKFTHILYDIRYVDGDYSSFSPEEKNLFRKYENEYLVQIKTDGPYRLFNIRG